MNEDEILKVLKLIKKSLNIISEKCNRCDCNSCMGCTYSFGESLFCYAELVFLLHKIENKTTAQAFDNVENYLIFENPSNLSEYFFDYFVKSKRHFISKRLAGEDLCLKRKEENTNLLTYFTAIKDIFMATDPISANWGDAKTANSREVIEYIDSTYTHFWE